MLKYDFHRGWYSPSNGAIVDVVHLDIDVYFQGYKIGNANIWNTARVSEKCSSMTFMVVDVRHRKEPLRLLYSLTLTWIFKVKHVTSTPWKRWELAEKCGLCLLSTLIFAIEWHRCACCTHGPYVEHHAELLALTNEQILHISLHSPKLKAPTDSCSSDRL